MCFIIENLWAAIVAAGDPATAGANGIPVSRPASDGRPLRRTRSRPEVAVAIGLPTVAVDVTDTAAPAVLRARVLPTDLLAA